MNRGRGSAACAEQATPVPRRQRDSVARKWGRRAERYLIASCAERKTTTISRKRNNTTMRTSSALHSAQGAHPMRTFAGVACALLLCASASAQEPSVDAAACAQLVASLKLTNTTVTFHRVRRFDDYNRLVETIGQRQVGDAVRRQFPPAWGHCGGGKRSQRLRHGDGDGSLARSRNLTGRSARVAHDKRRRRSHPAALPLSPGGSSTKGSGSIDRAENFVCKRRSRQGGSCAVCSRRTRVAS